MKMIYKVLFISEIPQSYYLRYKLIEGGKTSRIIDESKGKKVVSIVTSWEQSQLRTWRTLKTSGEHEGAQVNEAWHN